MARTLMLRALCVALLCAACTSSAAWSVIPTVQECRGVETDFLNHMMSMPRAVHSAHNDTCVLGVLPFKTNAWGAALVASLDRSQKRAAIRHLLRCEREKQLRRAAEWLCAAGGPPDESLFNPLWNLYREQAEDGKGQRLKACNWCSHLNAQWLHLVPDCMRSKRPNDVLTLLGAANESLVKRLVRSLSSMHSPIESVLDIGSGAGHWSAALARAGVRTVVGLQPGYLGSLGYYLDTWDAQYQALQVDGSIYDQAFRTFVCLRWEEELTPQPFDLIWIVGGLNTAQGCQLLNHLLSMAKTWVLVANEVESLRPWNPNSVDTLPDDTSSIRWEEEMAARGLSREPLGLLQEAPAAGLGRNALLFKRASPHADAPCMPDGVEGHPQPHPAEDAEPERWQQDAEPEQSLQDAAPEQSLQDEALEQSLQDAAPEQLQRDAAPEEQLPAGQGWEQGAPQEAQQVGDDGTAAGQQLAAAEDVPERLTKQLYASEPL